MNENAISNFLSRESRGVTKWLNSFLVPMVVPRLECDNCRIGMIHRQMDLIFSPHIALIFVYRQGNIGLCHLKIVCR